MAGTKGLLVLFAALSLAFYFNSLRDIDPFIPHFNINVSADNHEDQIRNLLPAISSNYINVTIEKLTAGTANYMYKCISTIHPNVSILLFRIFGEGASSLCNRAHEVEMIKLFYKQKLGAQVFATFENGYVLEYLEGKTLQPSNLREPYFYIPIARKLGQLHKYKQPAKEAKTQGPNRGIFNHLSEWLSVCRKVVPQDDKETHKHLDLVTKEISTLQNKLERQYGNQSLVFSHNDLNYANVIYNPKDNEAEILLLDLEYAGFNFRGFDLGNHFCEMAGQGEIDWNSYPSHDTMRKFIRAYLEGNGAVEITEQEVDNLVVEAERWAQVSHVGWHVWALAMAQADNKVTSDFDYLKYSYNRWHEFVRRQESLKNIL